MCQVFSRVGVFLGGTSSRQGGLHFQENLVNNPGPDCGHYSVAPESALNIVDRT